MFRKILFVGSLFMFSQASALNCLNKVFSDQNRVTLTEKQIQCLLKDLPLQVTAQTLCDSERQITEAYKSFRHYQLAYMAAEGRFLMAKNPEWAQAAADQMMTIDHDWAVLGQKGAISVALAKILTAYDGVSQGCGR